MLTKAAGSEEVAMAIQYGVLRARPDRYKREDGASTPHLQIRALDASGQPWRVAVNVQSDNACPKLPSQGGLRFLRSETTSGGLRRDAEFRRLPIPVSLEANCLAS